MATRTLNSIPCTALLSAAAASGESGLAPAGRAVDVVGGQSLLEYQISLLARAGISRFLVEVDNVGGSLLHLADKSREKGRLVEFVRSGADVQRLLQPGDRLLVQSETLFVAPTLLDDMLRRSGTFVATLDGRDENDAFERIDLNTRWAGIALVDANTISALQNLPEGWSMTSSLLRQALQDKVPFYALHQQHVQGGQLRIIRTAEDANALSRQMLLDRSDSGGGFIESKILGPLAVRIAPVIWRSSMGGQLVSIAAVLSAAASAGLGAFGWDIAAVVAALLAVALNILHGTVVDPDDNGLLLRRSPLATWILLAIAVLGTARADMSYSSDGIFAAFTVAGLALLAQKLALPVWAEHLLKSPALIAVLALIATPIGGFAQAMQWIAIGQLSAMIAAKWQGKARKKKTQ